MNDAARIPPPPLLIALAGAPQSGRDTIALHLKRRHGFAKTAFTLPLYQAVSWLYGIGALDYAFGNQDEIVESVGKSVRHLVAELSGHVRAHGGDDLLIRRLVERCTERGEFLMQDLVIADLQHEVELEWLRHVGGRVWWIQREGTKSPQRPTLQATQLLLRQYRRQDTVIRNDGSLAQFVDQADAALHAMRTAAEVA